MAATHVPFDTVLFDLDGTLVETAPDLTAALNHTLRHFGFGPLEVGDVRSMIGDGARKLLQLGMEANSQAYDAALDQEAFDILLAYYWDHIAENSVPFPGIVQVLDALRQQNCRLAVCSNKPEAFSAKLLSELDLARYFDAIRGGDSYAVRKPDPLHVTQTIADAGGTVQGSVMIGDSENDRAAAHNAGIPVILVTFGYTQTPVTELGADGCIDHFDDLLAALHRLA